MLTPEQSRKSLGKDEWRWIGLTALVYGAFVRQHIPATWLKWADLAVFSVLVLAGVLFIYLFGYGDHTRVEDWWRDRLTCVACTDRVDRERRTASEHVRRWLWRLP